jgi:uncharacterized protein (TIGR01244 family)
MRTALVAFTLALAAALPVSCAHRPAGPAGGGARDSAAVVALLGGTLNAACPVPGVATGGQPDSARFAALAAAGFRSVIDARMPDEPRGFDAPAVARAAGLEYVALPVSAATLADSTFDAFRALMRDGRREPVLVYCSSGNRVGALVVPWLVLDRGWPLERALASAEAGGMRPGPVRDRALDYVKRRGAR